MRQRHRLTISFLRKTGTRQNMTLFCSRLLGSVEVYEMKRQFQAKPSLAHNFHFIIMQRCMSSVFKPFSLFCFWSMLLLMERSEISTFSCREGIPKVNVSSVLSEIKSDVFIRNSKDTFYRDARHLPSILPEIEIARLLLLWCLRMRKHSFWSPLLLIFTFQQPECRSGQCYA